jgi:lipopolysaccharide assembly LptE-like protein
MWLFSRKVEKRAGSSRLRLRAVRQHATASRAEGRLCRAKAGGHWLLLLVLAVAGFSSGCGYALAGRGNFLPDYIRTIGVPAFTNLTSYFDIGQIVTDKIRTEFIGRGNYKIVPELTGADAVLVGSITGISIVPTAFSTQQASRYVITMTANIELRDSQKSTVLWTNPSVTVREEYDATGGQVSSADPTVFVDPSAFFNQETNAVERVSDEFARAVVSAILEAF